MDTRYEDHYDSQAIVPSGKIASLFAYMRERGLDPGALVERIKADPESWRDPETSVPLDVWLALNREAARSLDDQDFGLGFGRYFWGMPTLLGHLMGACETAGDALDAFIRYQGIEHHSWRIEKRTVGSSVDILYEALHPLSHDRLIVDFVFSHLVSQIQRLGTTPLVPESVHFSYRKPAETGIHTSIFASQVTFENTCNILRITAETLATPLRTASRPVREQLSEPLETALRADTVSRRISGKVVEAIARQRGGRSADEASVASELGFGVRDLQLKLKAEGTTFRKLREAFLRRTAFAYLEDPEIGVKEIAFLLGFSEPSAFHRAFLRWTGITPGAARAASVK